MLIARGIIGGVLLFVGREFNFLFAAGMAALLGIRLTPLLPSQWPWYYDYIFLGVLAAIAIALTLIHERFGYFFSGFLAGGYLLVEYSAPGLLTVPLLPFLLGGVIGSLLIGIFTDWALILVSSASGAYFLTNMFVLPSTTQILVTSGLFVIGAVTQVVLWRMQKD